jgi:hypothetical protein
MSRGDIAAAVFDAVYADGSPIQDLSPNIAAAVGMGPALNQNSAFDVYDADNQPFGWGVFNGLISRRANTSQSTRGSDALNINGVVFAFGEPFNVSEGQALWLEGRAYCTANATLGQAPNFAAYLAYLDGAGNNTGQTEFALNAPVAVGTAVQALPTKLVVPTGFGIKKAQWRFYTDDDDTGAEIVLDYLAAYSSEPAATNGAQTGANLRDANGVIITDPAIKNSQIVVNADGTASYFNGSSSVNLGAVTITGMGGGALAFRDRTTYVSEIAPVGPPTPILGDQWALLSTGYVSTYTTTGWQQTANIGATQAQIDAIENAQTFAENASDAAAQANTVLADIASDNVLTAGEKSSAILAYDVIIAEQASITNTATLHGISTAAYTAAVTALTAYLTGLTVPVLWSDVSGSTAIIGPTFRAKFKDVYDARQVLLNVVAARTATVEAGADVTANAQVTVIPPVAQVINRSYTGAQKPNEFPRTLTPVIKRGSTDIRAANDVTVNLIANANFTATANTTNGDANKGRITITAGSAGSLRFNVVVGGGTYGPFEIPFTVNDDAAPQGGGSGGSGTTTATDADFPQLSSGAYTQITRQNAGEQAMNVIVAAGQSINYSLSAIYQFMFTATSGPVILDRSVKIKVGYRVAGSADTFTYGPEFFGTLSSWDRTETTGDPGQVILSDAFTGLATGTYEIGFFAALNLTSANGDMTITDGTAYAGAA